MVNLMVVDSELDAANRRGIADVGVFALTTIPTLCEEILRLRKLACRLCSEDCPLDEATGMHLGEDEECGAA